MSSPISPSDYLRSLEPELFENYCNDMYKDEYRICCTHGGQFKCKFIDLVVNMGGRGKILYKIVSWDRQLLEGLGQMEPAGPLYSINSLDGTVLQLQLPHCETRTDVVKLFVAHVTGGNVELIKPLTVTKTHVIIDVQGFSLFGLLKPIFQLFKAYPITAQVLLFYEKRLCKLHIHLLPGNVPVKEVQKGYDSNTYIQTSSKCQLTPGKKYRPDCKTTDRDYVLQPEDEMFDCDYGPNYHPTFEVLFTTAVNIVTLCLLDENNQVVWTPRRLLLGKEQMLIGGNTLAAAGRESALTRTDKKGANFVDCHRGELIHRVSSVMEILDCLISKSMISIEMYDKIHAQSISHEQMRLLYKLLDSGGLKVKSEFYKILREKDPFLVEDLESGLSLT